MRPPRQTGRARVVIDSGPLIALTDASDTFHQQCADWYACDRSQLLLPIPVITEVCFTLEKVGGPALEADFLTQLSKERRFTLCAPGRTELQRMAEVIMKYEGLRLGAADAAVIAMAEKYDTTTIVTVDRRDFSAIRPAGGGYYTLLP